MKVTNNYNLPDAIVKALTSDYKYKPYQFSVTTILSGIKSFLLAKRHQDEIVMDASEGINMLLGTAIHNIFEGHENEDELAEEYIKVKVNDLYFISGRFDLYNLKEEEVTDYKTCSIWKIKFKDFDDWKKQLLIYSWMLRKLGLKVKKAKITALIKDWKKTDLNLAKLKGEYYPETPIINVPFEFTEQDFIDIELWIYERFEQIKEYELLQDDDIPTCSEEERWYTGTKFAVKKGTNKTAVRVFDNEDEANELAKTNDQYWVEVRKGKNTKCEDYCSACQWCKFYKENVEVLENVN